MSLLATAAKTATNPCREIEGRKEIQRLKNDGYLNLPQGSTNILVATRDEIIA